MFVKKKKSQTIQQDRLLTDKEKWIFNKNIK